MGKWRTYRNRGGGVRVIAAAPEPIDVSLTLGIFNVVTVHWSNIANPDTWDWEVYDTDFSGAPLSSGSVTGTARSVIDGNTFGDSVVWIARVRAVRGGAPGAWTDGVATPLP